MKITFNSTIAIALVISSFLFSGCISQEEMEANRARAEASRENTKAVITRGEREELEFLLPICLREMENKPFDEAALLAYGYEPTSSIFGEKGAYAKVPKTISQKERDAANGGKLESSAYSLRMSKYKYIRVSKKDKGCVILRPLWKFSDELYPSQVDSVMNKLGFAKGQTEKKRPLSFGGPKYYYSKGERTVQLSTEDSRENGQMYLRFLAVQ